MRLKPFFANFMIIKIIIGVFQNDIVGIPILRCQNDNDVNTFLENVPNFQRFFRRKKFGTLSKKYLHRCRFNIVGLEFLRCCFGILF